MKSAMRNIIRLSLLVALFSMATNMRAQDMQNLKSNMKELIFCMSGPVVMSECDPQHTGIVMVAHHAAVHRTSSGELKVWYLDSDGDGLGDPFTVIITSERPHGYSENSDDMDDTKADFLTTDEWQRR